MKLTLELISKSYLKASRWAVAFSGGNDSLVLLDIIYRYTDHRPDVVFSDSQMEYPETIEFIQKTCDQYGAKLHIGKSNRTPEEQWKKSGWPMLGKLAARKWMQAHKGRDFGFKLDVSSCCRNMKIAPARKLSKKNGIEGEFTGQRGRVDDMLRGMRQIIDSSIFFHKSDKIWISNPLEGWTDMMIKRYIKEHDLEQHPAKLRGAETIGCMFCGGGAQFANGGFVLLRKTNPEAWWNFMVEMGAGEVVLAIKYDLPVGQVREAIGSLGGLDGLARERPWVFNFLRKIPLRPTYERVLVS